MTNFAPKAAHIDDDPFADSPVTPIDMNTDPFADQSWEAQDVVASRPAPTRKKFGGGVMSSLSKLFRGRNGRSGQEAAVAESIDGPFDTGPIKPINMDDDPFGGPLEVPTAVTEEYTPPTAAERADIDVFATIRSIKGEYDPNGGPSKAARADLVIEGADTSVQAARRLIYNKDYLGLSADEVQQLTAAIETHKRAAQ